MKVIGPDSANGRVYLPEALSGALCLYEGASVNLDHPAKGSNGRSVLDRFGWLEQCRIEGGSVWANLHYNPKHVFAEAFAWWAANQPNKLGLSHNAVGTGRERADKIFEVHRIVKVHSVDLVSDPATTKGLHEHEGGDMSQRQKAVKVCDEARLPAVARSDYFLGHLAGLPTEQAMREAVEDRLVALGLKSPASGRSGGGGQGQGGTRFPANAREFAEAVTTGRLPGGMTYEQFQAALFKGTGVRPGQVY